MTTKPGPKEQQLRAMREEMIKRTAQNQKLQQAKVKAKAVGQVIRTKASRRGK